MVISDGVAVSIGKCIKNKAFEDAIEAKDYGPNYSYNGKDTWVCNGNRLTMVGGSGVFDCKQCEPRGEECGAKTGNDLDGGCKKCCAVEISHSEQEGFNKMAK